jgi:anthranilate synthase component 1
MATTVPSAQPVTLHQDERHTTLVPMWRELPADLETPVSSYLKLAHGHASFLLESVEGGERAARFSFVGSDPYLVLRVRDKIAEYHWLRGERAGTIVGTTCADPLEAVRVELERRPLESIPGLPRFSGGAVGYLGYEVAAYFEPSVPIPEPDPLGLPDASFAFYDTLLVFDHVRHRAHLLTHADCPEDETGRQVALVEAEMRLDDLQRRLEQRLPRQKSRVGRAGSKGRRAQSVQPVESAAPSNTASRDSFLGAVMRVQEYIRAGDCYQAVMSRRVSRQCRVPPFEVYRALRSINPSPYMFYLAEKDFALAGASPEMLVRVSQGEVSVHPIAGTRRRDLDPAVDARLAADLLADEKERAEHIMLLDLGRNDVGRVSEPGSVAVTQFLEVERYSHVMHLVSHVIGRLRAGQTSYDALRAGFPAGTLSGAPKIRAMQIIAELESERRGVYGGAVGYLGFDGNLDMCIVIRTLLLKDGTAYAQAGSGIVADSDPGAEFLETENKLGAVMQALAEAETRCYS